MVILGIDPGIATVGFGIVESHRSQCRAIQYGVLSTPAGLPLSRRLTMIYEDMQELIHTFHPDEMAAAGSSCWRQSSLGCPSLSIPPCR